jgi:hypothetical protein
MIIWTESVKNEVFHRDKQQRNILHTGKKKEVWIGHILRRNCFLKHVIEGKTEGKMEVTGRREGRRKHLLDDLKKNKDYRKLKEEALDRTLWRTGFETGYSPVVKQTKNERRNI